jgi:HSP20 family protein
MRWDPFRELEAMSKSLDRLFDEFTGLRPTRTMSRSLETLSWQPAVEVSETESEVLVKAELPGVDPKDVDISLTENQLSLKAETRHQEEEKNRNFIRREMRYGSFLRVLELPAVVNSGEAKAVFKHGILELRMPKRVPAKPAQVKVKVETEK